jgi:hypothetical protein
MLWAMDINVFIVIVDYEYNMSISLTIGFALVNNFSLHLNVGAYIKITNFREMFKNRFERLDVCLEGGLE